jgi:small subunit ribosomal protein S16
VDAEKARDGAYIDKIGHYNPLTTPAEVVIDADKAKYWLSVGVQPTETVRSLLLNAGIIEKSAKLSPSKTNPKKKKG